LTAALVLPGTVSGRVVLLAHVLPIWAARAWLQDDAVETVFQHRDRRTYDALGFSPDDSCEDVNASPKKLMPVITGGLSAVLAML
jgi:hypothetical protein